MKTIYQKGVSITLAKVTGDAILPHDSGTTESRYLDAQLFNHVGYKKIIENRREVLSMDDFESATEFAVNLIN